MLHELLLNTESLYKLLIHIVLLLLHLTIEELRGESTWAGLLHLLLLLLLLHLLLLLLLLHHLHLLHLNVLLLLLFESILLSVEASHST